MKVVMTITKSVMTNIPFTPVKDLPDFAGVFFLSFISLSIIKTVKTSIPFSLIVDLPDYPGVFFFFLL